MKKRSLILLVLLLAGLLTSCGNAADSENKTANTANSSAAVAESKYVFQVANKDQFQVKIDQNMSDVLAALGEPLSYFEAASCAFEGLDKTYTYAGFIITTRPDGEQDFVNSVRLTDDSVTTPEGVYIGVTPDAVIAAYGEAAEQTDTLIQYTDGNTSLNFTLQDGAVISIEYLSATAS